MTESNVGGDIVKKLLEKKVISDDQFEIALKEYEKHGGQKNMGAIMADLGFVSEATLGEILKESTGIKKFDIKGSIIDSKLVKKIPKEFAIANKLIAVTYTAETVVIAMADVFDIISIDQARRFFPPSFRLDPVYTPEAEILQAIDQYYDYEMSIDGILKEIEGSKSKTPITEAELKGGYKSPMVRLVDAILADAIHRGASDLHFEPEQHFVRIRYRIDGKMTQIRSIHKQYWSSFIVRLKIMSNMNITETRRPQDGRISSEIMGRKIDFRVSNQPTVYGENVVMRVLDEKQSILSLDMLGFSEHCISILKRIVQRPEGVIILTGPTGSGKTTTLYTVLSYINSIDKNIMTLEDPVEYRLPLIRQSNIKADSGMDFASGIKALLRQDPDVILVGEIRDKETAVTAIQAAMTGHQVFSSLHTNDAIGSIPRLLNIGVPPYLLSGALIGVQAQRLARKLCPNCKKEFPIEPQEKKLLGEKYTHIEKLYRSVGCEKCRGGYKGRLVICEILPFDRELDELIVIGATRKAMIEHALKNGFVPMVEDGIEKVVKGIIDLKELIRVVDLTERM
jgi:type II secretory ATPase GspE/PulE/Tfp pilus assembly ATPase PilB-like protein